MNLLGATSDRTGHAVVPTLPAATRRDGPGMAQNVGAGSYGLPA
jgi:hypothetical protein